MSSFGPNIYPRATGLKFSSSYMLEFKNHLAKGLEVAKPIFKLVMVFWACGFLYLCLFYPNSLGQLFSYFKTLFPVIGILAPGIFVLTALMSAKRRAKHRVQYAFKRLFGPRNTAKMVTGVAIMIAICLFMGMFTSLKVSFAPLFGFNHDLWQADLDKFLFFGHEPWHILFTPFHALPFQKIIEVNYNLIWHMLVFLSLSLVVYSDYSKEMRVRYIACFLWSWIIIGTMFASLFLSAGPAYYGLVTGDFDRFGAQMAILAQYEASIAVGYQAYLWDNYIYELGRIGGGISAFPSMHVALVALNMMFAFEINKKLGWIATAYALFVWYSSVYLAWHYAIDGLVSFVLVATIYAVVKKMYITKPSALA